MNDNIHDRRLLETLAQTNAEILSQYTLLDKKEINEHQIKYTVLSYDNGLVIGIFYLSWNMPGKKGQSPAIYHDLAAVGLKSNDENAAQQTIDTLMEPSNARIPLLRTSRYLIADGNKAAELYRLLVTEPPTTALDLANVIGRYINKSGHYSSQGWASKIPNPQMRIRLGRGV